MSLMRVFSAAQIKAIDREAVRRGVPEATLMDTAGSAVADFVLKRLHVCHAVVVAGIGGNGGDALVCARRLHESGADVRMFVLAPVEALTPTTRDMARLFITCAPERVTVIEDDISALEKALMRADCVIDGMLGIGVSRPLDGRYAAIVRAINRADVLRVAIDMPTGLATDTGGLIGDSVYADHTLAMAAYKPSHLLYPARSRCGKITIVPVGYPPEIVENIEATALVVDREWVRAHLPSRDPAGHKGSFGRVLVVAGSRGMSGAAILCAGGALRAGAGLVTVACSESIEPIVAAAIPEVITVPLTDANGHLSRRSLPRLLTAANAADVLAIGPGLSRAPSVGAVILHLLHAAKNRIVLDADGIFPLRNRLARLARLAGRTVLTPHPGEMSRLIAQSPDEIDAKRIEVARLFAQTYRTTLLLKGQPTAIGTVDGKIYLNPTGNTGLATGGSGDVLTGLVAGFLAGGASPTDAAIIGAFVHGAVADRLARTTSERSMLPSDLIRMLPHTLASIERGKQAL